MKRIVRYFAAATILIAILAIAGTVVPRPLFAHSEPPKGKQQRILLLSNPIHTDIALPATSEILARFTFLKQADLHLDSQGLAWIVFGWGGRSFYIETPTWAELKVQPVMRAFTVDRSVMHVELAGGIDESNPSVSVMTLSHDGLERLAEAIGDTFVMNGKLGLPIADAAYGPNDAFFEAKGKFNALLGCNTWTAKMLRSAGFQTGWWNPLPLSLNTSLSLHND